LESSVEPGVLQLQQSCIDEGFQYSVLLRSYLEAILQRIITIIVFVCLRPSNRRELLYR
jgi:hypothetical protein